MRHSRRENFAPSEVAAIARALLPAAKADARQRQREHGNTCPGKRSRQAESFRALDVVARKVGMSCTTVAKILAIVAAAEIDPAQFGPLVDEMDTKGRVDGVFKRLVAAQKTKSIGKDLRMLPMGAWIRGIRLRDLTVAAARRTLKRSMREAQILSAVLNHVDTMECGEWVKLSVILSMPGNGKADT